MEQRKIWAFRAGAAPSWFQGRYYGCGICCWDCRESFTDENARERILEYGDPTQPWEGELTLDEEFDRAQQVEWVCEKCWLK